MPETIGGAAYGGGKEWEDRNWLSFRNAVEKYLKGFIN